MAVNTALVIDDSKSARIMLSRLVQKNGLEVNMVESGEEAINYLATNPLPDVIFMDHMMPGMDGLEATRIISQNARTKHIPILMYTSKEGPEYEAEVMDSGAYGMLGKPAKPERLTEIIDELNARSLETITQTESIETNTINAQVTSTVEEDKEEEMSKEMIEEVAIKLITRAIEDAMQPINSSLQKLDTATQENRSDIRKLTSRQEQQVSLVSQAVLDASLKQTTTQLQTQITTEIKSIRDLLEQKSELSPKALEQIKQIASQSGGESGAQKAEKAAMSAAEAVAAKVSAAQAQIQVQQDIAPLINQVKKANIIAVCAIAIGVIAIIKSFI